ncbi:TonB-dependent receptor [Sphingomonas piscis]|uniref:TonB-dependent receptor n=1 Tax=Sphingomonas piscis TaxID=2714943 RepID=A0A6G7YPZ8_9SPHN|nr:TonB-dependent receptor [Sphingomonas piscis]QIK78811.1 TonB-dependent receptor [Sphingomonas piscis]
MTDTKRLLIGALLAGVSLVPHTAAAQTSGSSSQPAPSTGMQGAPPVAAVEDEDAVAEDEIVVIGRRDPNAVIGDIPAENQLSPADIRATGATSVTELLEAIAPQTASSRGRGGGQPVILLNGRRTSGFREVRDLPPEAILRVDILPEEVALKYGYRADQRVVNFVLRPRFRSTTAQIEGGVPTAGGYTESEADLTRLMIGENSRTTINLHAERSGALLESEREIAFETDSSDEVDPRGFRTLTGPRRLVRATGTLNRNLIKDVSSTFSGQVQYSDGQSLLGPSLFSIGDPLARDTDTLSGEAGFAFNGNKDRWRWSLTGEYSLSRSNTDTDRENVALGLVSDRARTITRNGEIDLLLNGPLVSLPAGTGNVSLRVGADTQSLDGKATRFGVTSETDLGRREVDASVNVDLPIARRDEFLGAIGNLTLNANAEVERLSDFGTLTTWGAGAYWSPIREVNLITSFTQEEGAPSLAQLGNPILSTPNSRIFDFVTGRDATVELISGGNPDLDSDRRRVFKFGGTIKPLEGTDLELRADYTHSKVRNPISNFPGITAAIEAAFPDRFTRDADGNLIRADLRPVNTESYERSEIRWGFNFSKPLTSARPSQAQIEQFRRRAAESGQPLPPFPQGGGGGAGPTGGRGADRAGGGGGGFGRGGGGGGFGGFGGGRQGGRLQLSVFHTVLLKDTALIAEGLPALDYLGGFAPEGGLGRPQHRIEANGGYFNNGLGFRLAANWQSGSLVTGGQSGTLRFSPLTKVNANLFANLGQRFDLVAKYPWLRGTQVRLSVDNIFDSKQNVRDGLRLIPINYQPDLLDPQGRVVKLSLRKQFLPPPSFFRRNGGQQPGEGSRAAPAPQPAPPTTGPAAAAPPAGG